MGERPETSRAQAPNALLKLLASGEEERQAREWAALLDDEAFEELAMAEDELVDELASGRVGPGQHPAAAALLASSPRLRERVAVSQLLTHRARRHSRGQRYLSAPAVLAAAATVGFLAVGLVWLLPVIERPEDTLLQLALAAPRGAVSVRVVEQPVHGGALLLQAEVGAEPAASFRVTVLDALGEELVSREGIQPQVEGGRRVVSLEVPWGALGPGFLLVVVSAEQAGGRIQPVAYHELEVVPPGPS